MKVSTGTALASALAAVQTAAVGQIVKDGSFEAGTPNPVWEEHSQNFPSPLCNVQRCGNFFGDPHDGDWWVWFGGAEQRESGYVRQSVTIPEGTAKLTFWLDITASSGNGKDYVAVSVDNDELFRALESDAGQYHPWTQVEVDLTAYADGRAHLLTFSSDMIGPQRSNFFVDQIEIAVEGGLTTCVYTVTSAAKGKKGCPTEACPAKGSQFNSGDACGPPECAKKQTIKKLDCPTGEGFCKKVKLKKAECR